MARHLWTIMCARAVVDRTSNTISLTDVIEELHVGLSAFPAEGATVLLPVSMNLVVCWERTNRDQPETIPTRTIFQTPNGHQLGVAEVEANMTNHVRWRSIVQINGFPVRGPGTYAVVTECMVDTRWTEVDRISLDVIYENEVAPGLIVGPVATG